MKFHNHTFVVCAYQESAYLRECLESLVKQTVESRIIMVTSTPNDLIRNLVEEFRIPLFINNGKHGIAADWNFGISKATTKYVTIAHQDDVYLPTYLETVLGAFRKDPGAVIAFTGYGELRDGKTVNRSVLLAVKNILLTPLKLPVLKKTSAGRRMALCMGNPICCPAVTYNRTYLSDEFFEDRFKSNMDWMAWAVLSKKGGNFLYCKEALMLHRIHEESTTSGLIAEDKRSEEDLAVFREFWPEPIAKQIAKLYKSSEKFN